MAKDYKDDVSLFEELLKEYEEEEDAEEVGEPVPGDNINVIRQQVQSGGGGKGGGGKGNGTDVSQLPGFRVGIRPFKGVVDGKAFCMPYNRGQQCWFGTNCNKWHKCSATLPDGSACNSEDHSFQGHPLS